MTLTLLQVYHQLPPPLQDLAASLQGLRLRRWRHGPETERLVAEALERDEWDAERWRTWQEDRLARLLHRAVTQVPWYRRHWAARRQRGDRAGWEHLEHWPILRKEDVRANPRAFLAEDAPRRLYEEQTSGSTGAPLRLWWSRETVRAWAALYEARWRRWHGVSWREPSAMLGGRLVVPIGRQEPPFWVHNRPMRQLYLSTYHIRAGREAEYLDAIARHAPTHIYGYPSALAELATGSARYHGPPLRVVTTGGEALSTGQRARIADTFGCPVRETYSMAEFVAAAGECEAGTMHLWPDVGYLEVLGEAGAPAPVGAVVATGLVNQDMPLIRYPVGDRVRLGPAARCTCGRGLPRLAAIEGREFDMLRTPDGRFIASVETALDASIPIRAAQIRQEAHDRIRVLVEPTAEFTQGHARQLEAAIRQRLGEVEVVVERVREIPRNANGKFRLLVYAVDQDPGAERT